MNASKLQTASRRITDEVTSWPGVEAGPGRRGEFAFTVGRREIGHLHGDHAAHFMFPKDVGAKLKEAGRIVDHPVFPGKPGPGAHTIDSDRDIDEVIELMRLNYDRVVARYGHPDVTEVVRRHFAFQSEGESLVGNLFLPEQSKPLGVVVAVGPLTSVKEQAAGSYAQAMAERGYAALAFDYRYFGESGGQPRQFESPKANIEDIRNAATALQSDDQLTGLPLFGLGICFGAGPMVCAVEADPRFRAFAGAAGVYTDNAKTRELMGDAYQATIERGRAAERKWRETGEAETIRAVAPDGGDVAMPLREAYEFYGTPRGQVPNYVNGYAVQSSAYTLPFDARGAADTIKVPVLMVHSDKALTPDLAHAFYAAVKSPKRELWLRSQGQIDFYDDPRLVTPTADAVAEFWAESQRGWSRA